ncbi:MAG: transcriptional repressor LexA [Actinomycetota bacterium]|nr:transcriptional repressor LexA [Actinomycetota bacterium]
MKKLTPKQEKVLEIISQFIAQKGYPPTVRELAQRLGLASPRAVSDHLAALQKKGYIEKTSLARSIKITDGSGLAVQPKIPLIGSIAAGSPILAEQNIETYISIPGQLEGKNIDFALRVKGDSMIGDHIQDGDIILAQSRQTAENGDMVVALIGEEATVKRYYLTPQYLELRPSNPDYEPIRVTGDVIIQGKVLSVYRKL